MKRVLRYKYCFLFLLALILQPVSVFASDCYLQLRFTESVEGDFSDISFNAVGNDLYNSAIRNELANPEAERQIHFVGLDEAGEDVVLTRFNTGLPLRALAEGLRGHEAEERAKVLSFPMAKKNLFLPVTEGMKSIKFLVGEEYVAELPVRAEELECAQNCTGAGEVLVEEYPCCIGLNAVESEGGVVCSDVGNGICESWEDEKSAPNDCSPEVVLQNCGNGLQLLSCSQLVADYGMTDEKNRVRRNNHLAANSSVSFSILGARFRGRRGALNAGRLTAGAPKTVAITFETQQSRGKQGLLEFSTNSRRMSLGIARNRLILNLAVRRNGLEVNGRRMRRFVPVRGARSSARRGTTLLSRKAIQAGKNTAVLSITAVPEKSGQFTFALYLNGELTASTETNFEMNFEDSLAPRFAIGRNQSERGNGYSFSGLVSNVRVFTRSLSDLEREQLFK